MLLRTSIGWHAESQDASFRQTSECLLQAGDDGGTHASLKCDLGPESLTGLAEPGTGGMMRAWELSWEAPEDTSENSKSGGRPRYGL